MGASIYPLPPLRSQFEQSTSVSANLIPPVVKVVGLASRLVVVVVLVTGCVEKILKRISEWSLQLSNGSPIMSLPPIRVAQLARGYEMEKALFTIEGEIVVDGVHNPRNRWNGWAKPLLPLSSVVKVAEWMANCEANPADGGLPTIVDGVPHWVEENEDGYIVSAPIAPQVIDGVDHYDIGCGGWVWYEYTPPCEACAMLADDRDMTEAEARTANLCGDCEAYFGLAIEGGN